MNHERFLHEHVDFKNLLGIIANDRKILPGLVEKDYWMMHSLYGLQRMGLTFELKGGTSLAKGYQVIDRFSEDIDIRIEPPAELNVKHGKNHVKDIHIESRRNFFEWLAKRFVIPGIVSIERDRKFDDEKMRSGGIRLKYESHFSLLPKVKDGILLEVGFDDTAPNRKKTISSWALDRALTQKVAVIINQAVHVPCYLPEYTFVEKLQAVSTKFRQQQATGDFPSNFMRHYYDIYKLLELPSVHAYIGTPEYYARKKERFRGGDNLDISKNEAFLLDDKGVRSLYETEYRKGGDLYLKGQVPFEEILKRIQSEIEKL